jgi:hypothetical protein
VATKRIVSLVSILSLSGCSGITTFDRLVAGEPVISDSVWLRVSDQVQDRDATQTNFIPSTCFAPTTDAVGGSTIGRAFVKDETNIAACVSDMKTLIDRRFDEWMDSLAATTNDSNAIIDVAVIGAGLAGAGAGGATSRIMNAVSSGLTGTKTTINQDIFLSQSVQAVITQMNTDRTKWATIIEAKVEAAETGQTSLALPGPSLQPATGTVNVIQSNARTIQTAPRAYINLGDAMNDLQIYRRQGSFQNALYNLQTNASAQSAACQASNLNLKSGLRTSVLNTPAAGHGAVGRARPTTTTTTTGSSSTPTTKCQTTPIGEQSGSN